jgi:hypothetical protein
MNQNNVTPHKQINQRQLKEMLNLSANEIRDLKKTGRLKFQRVGTQDIFDETSIKRFMDTFKHEDHLTIGRCHRILDRCGYYTFRDRRQLVSNLGFYVTVVALTRNHPDIPPEYRLETTTFGTTQYIRRDQFKKTLNWMRDIRNEKIQGKPISKEAEMEWSEKLRKEKSSNQKPKYKKKIKSSNVPDTGQSELIVSTHQKKIDSYVGILKKLPKSTNPIDSGKSKSRMTRQQESEMWENFKTRMKERKEHKISESSS